MTDENRLEPTDVTEGMRVRLGWSARGAGGTGDDAEGTVTRVWATEGGEEGFTVEIDAGYDLNVYADYRTPPVERVEGDDDPETETVGRLDELTLLER